MNQNTKPKRYNYHIYDLRLCKMDADGNFELHPNGQPKLYNYNSDGLSDVHYSEMCNLNDGEEMEEYSNWVEPIPMEDKPINRIQMPEPTVVEVIRLLSELPFPIYFGKDRDEVLEVLIPIKQKQYPFNEGDTYYTLENNTWVESCWDCVSEEMHDENPNKKYYKAMNLESEVQNG
jgi:hypothetical protein